ncbi:MAG: sigma-70 family RNA polymerase sigma factor [Candidatus Peribacter sp.]|jgi:RNA polymerase primary sigma factor|nr:sigma-70 family RNA polymerase sigma factor [Candidatus Peribacter sp.]MBT4393116.1 sigma-70 family RNA polymerase sigma factor [Candidatus Peribacter sp.]MBT4600915.1 sigma-70 family RNA polymerase sigma factor [Candidatus Peribacter sp.]MBT5148955.1 sigma-70 family RNA polymerase sigma factor [Candidatus Peribacter sp.]MBT5638366.1 sigma-70 family RNA polymerase sigma factor [Candidatus Peribacter sp.]
MNAENQVNGNGSSASTETEAASLTKKEAAEMFNVSEKTIDRWGQKYELPVAPMGANGCRQKRYVLAGLRQFSEKYQEVVERAGSFSLMSDEERRGYLSRGEALLESGKTRIEVIRTLAQESGRSREAIRYLLKGINVMSLKEREQCARTQEASQWNLKHIPTEEFLEPDAEKRIFTPTPENEKARRTKPPAGLPPYLASLYETPLMSREQEQHVFRRLHFALFRVSQILPEDLSQVTQEELEQAQKYMQIATEDEQFIIKSNLRLPVSIAKKFARGEEMFDLVSDYNMSLMKAVRMFDYSRGFKFSTYATYAIKNNASREFDKENARKRHFANGKGEMLDETADTRSDETALLIEQGRNEEQARELMSCLDDREVEIICRRYGFGIEEPETLKTVGEALGVTKERIRQIQSRAERKMRELSTLQSRSKTQSF